MQLQQLVPKSSHSREDAIGCMIVYVASVRDTLKCYGLTLCRGKITISTEDDPLHWVVEYNSTNSVKEHNYVDEESGRKFNMFDSLTNLLVSISVNQSLTKQKEK